MKNSLSNKYFLGILAFFLLAAVAFKFSGGSSSNKMNEGVAKRQDYIQKVTMAGTITPAKKTIVIAPYNGYVKKLFVKVGDKVKIGDPLVSVVQSLQNSDDAFPLRSPLNGIVVQVNKAEGEYVQQSDAKDFILRIDDVSKYEIRANVPEIDRLKLKVDQETIIKVSPILSRNYKGVIREIALAAIQRDEFSRSQNVEFPVLLEITDSDDKVKSGMSAVIDVITAKKKDVLMLQHEFIRQEKEKYFVIMSDGKKRDIEVGVQNEEGFEILAGLAEGEKVKQIDFSELSELK